MAVQDIFPPLRVGAVSFLNAKPLIYGLAARPGINLSLEVPSRLLDGLRQGKLDAALLPVIDYQALPGLRIIDAGGIACDGPTLTVRIFSRVPINQIRVLACDSDSHTSVALARVLLAERFNSRPEFIRLNAYARDGSAPAAADAAMLLIGDKVVCQEPEGFPHQLDLGQGWKELTGLPFAFAAWMVRGGVDARSLPDDLNHAKRNGRAHVEEIIVRDGVSRGWPLDIARKYLTEYLQFDITPRHIEAIELFHRLAHRHGILEHPPRPVELYGK